MVPSALLYWSYIKKNNTTLFAQKSYRLEPSYVQNDTETLLSPPYREIDHILTSLVPEWRSVMWRSACVFVWSADSAVDWNTMRHPSWSSCYLNPPDSVSCHALSRLLQKWRLQTCTEARNSCDWVFFGFFFICTWLDCPLIFLFFMCQMYFRAWHYSCSPYFSAVRSYEWNGKPRRQGVGRWEGGGVALTDLLHPNDWVVIYFLVTFFPQSVMFYILVLIFFPPAIYYHVSFQAVFVLHFLAETKWHFALFDVILLRK